MPYSGTTHKSNFSRLCLLFTQSSIKLGTNIQHVTEHCGRGFQGQRSMQLCDGGIHCDVSASTLNCFARYSFTELYCHCAQEG